MRSWIAALALGCSLSAIVARGDEAVGEADAIVARMNARDDGRNATRTITMELVDPDGTTRTRVARSYRRELDGERRTALFFEEPAALKGTAFLSFDYADPAKTDDQWLYLPELRKTRRIALAERGRAFLGTDLSFEDMKKETKIELSDFHWELGGEETVDGHRCWVVDGTAADARIARETGYGRLRMRVDADLAIPRFLEYWAPDGAPLKTIRLLDIEVVDGIETPQRVEAVNLQTGHRTTLRFERIDFRSEVPEDLLTEGALRRGAP